MVPSVSGFTSRSSGIVLEDLVAVPMDVGKHSAMAKVLDFTGTTLVKPFSFDLDRSGVNGLANRANRIAFAMVRDQRIWEASHWAA